MNDSLAAVIARPALIPAVDFFTREEHRDRLRSCATTQLCIESTDTQLRPKSLSTALLSCPIGNHSSVHLSLKSLQSALPQGSRRLSGLLAIRRVQGSSTLSHLAVRRLRSAFSALFYHGFSRVPVTHSRRERELVGYPPQDQDGRQYLVRSEPYFTTTAATRPSLYCLSPAGSNHGSVVQHFRSAISEYGRQATPQLVPAAGKAGRGNLCNCMFPCLIYHLSIYPYIYLC